MFDWKTLNDFDFFNPERSKIFLADLQKRVEDLGKEFGLELMMCFSKASCGKFWFGAKIGVSMCVTLKDGYRLSIGKEAVDFLIHHGFFGLERSALGQKITFKGKTMRLTGVIWNGKQTKFMCAICEANGRNYKIPFQMVKGLLPM